LVEKREGKRHLGGSRHRWEDNTKIDLQKVGCCGMDWIEQAQEGRGGGTFEGCNGPSGSTNWRNFLTS
jgi:hypothetical protein